ncbi:MAG: hypothetical protein EOM91_21795, partial [Sphingobacteriia bacterium]|nr:hypothetical protein [Sphingobacteriia bacterium]
MSGEKEVRLSESNCRRLLSAARQIENSRSHGGVPDARQHRGQPPIETRQAAAERRQQAFERVVDNLSQDLQSTVRDLHRHLVGQRLTEQPVEHFDPYQPTERRDYLGPIAEQVAQIQERLASIEQFGLNAQRQAALWMADADLILDYIAQHQRHEQFAPGQIDLLSTDLAMSRRNLDADGAQAAITSGRLLCVNALRLLAEIEFRQLEWDIHYSQALTGARTQLAAAEAQRTARWVIDTQQGSQELDAEIDYWSDGGLSALRRRLEQSIATLEQPPQTLSLEDLKRTIAANQDAMVDLESIVTAAKERLIASQLRVTIAQELLEELDRSGWQLEDAVWQGEILDGRGWKNSYHMKLKDLGGNEMISVIIPFASTTTMPSQASSSSLSTIKSAWTSDLPDIAGTPIWNIKTQPDCRQEGNKRFSMCENANRPEKNGFD